jgi:hypothetical protein
MHVEAVEVKTRTLISQLILYIDNDSIANSSSDWWNGPFSIDANDRTLKRTIRICSNPFDSEVVGPRISIDQMDR